MPLQLSLMTEDDIPAFVEVDDIAMTTYAYARAMDSDLPAHIPRKQFIEGLVRQGFKQDDTTAYLKVTDTEIGELIAAAMWTFSLEGEKPAEEKEPLPVDGEAVALVEASDVSDPKKQSFMAAADERAKKFRAKFIGTKPYAHLFALFTHPKHRGRGAASLLIDWGCQKADDLGIICSLQASPEGYNLYLKNGFEVVEQSELDLRPWGVDETTTRRAMIRQPKAKK